MAATALVGNMIAPGGGPASGCKLNSYIRSTTTRSPLYTSVLIDPVTSPKTPNPYVGDADGRLEFYFDNAIEYTWSVTTSDGATTIWEADVVGGVVTVTYTDAVLIHSSWTDPLATTYNGVRSVPTYAAFQALSDHSADETYIILGRDAAGDGGGGTFRWSASNQSAFITKDPYFGVYLPPTSDLTGASGCGIRQRTGLEASPAWWGSKPDYVTIFDGTDLGIYANRAILFLQRTGGGTLVIPDGTYRCTTTIVEDRSSDPTLGRISIRGSSSNAVTIYSEVGGGTITADGLTGAGALFDFKGNASDSQAFKVVSGISCLSYAGAGLRGVCFRSNLQAFGVWRDITVQGFGQVTDLKDCDHQNWDNFRHQFNIFGILAYKNPTPVSASTQPNQWMMTGCTHGSAQYWAMRLIGCGQLTIIGGSSEGNNSTGLAAAAMQIIDPCFEGAIALSATNFHSEVNKIADWYLRQTYDTSGEPNGPITGGIWSFNSLDFGRVNNATASINCIVVDWGPETEIGEQLLVLDQVGFKGYINYTPDAGSQYVVFTGAQQPGPNNVRVRNCICTSTIETPAWFFYGDKAFVEATRSTSQTISNTTETVWTANSESKKWGFASSIASGWMTIEESGLYDVEAFLQFTTLPSGQKIARVKRDVGGLGSTIEQVGIDDVTGAVDAVQVSARVRLAAGDKVAVSLYQSSGGTVDIFGPLSRFILNRVSV